MSRCQCRIREAKDHPSRPISWSYFLVPSHQRCMSNMPSRNKHSPRCNLKLAHWKLVKADWHTAAIVHQSVTKVELCQYPKCAIKLKYLCDNLKTKSPSPIIKCTLKIAYIPCKHSKSRYSALSSYQKYVLMMNTALLKMYPKAEQMIRVFRPWRSDQGPANKEYMQAGIACIKTRPIKKDTGKCSSRSGVCISRYYIVVSLHFLFLSYCVV